MSKIRVAALQLNSQPDTRLSLKEAEQWLRRASDAGAELAALPENFAFLGNERMMREQAADVNKAVMEILPGWSTRFGMNILAGGFPAPAGDGKVYNRSVLTGKDGSILSTYDKIHLFDVELSDEEYYRESDYVMPGDTKIKPVEIPVSSEKGDVVKAGLSICYDVRFPELYRRLAKEGAELFFVPSAFTRTTGKMHWEVLLRARAVENTSWVIAPAQTGTHGKKRETYGHAMIIHPDGRVLKDAGTETGFIIHEIDTDETREVRRKLPSLEHRRL